MEVKIRCCFHPEISPSQRNFGLKIKQGFARPDSHVRSLLSSSIVLRTRGCLTVWCEWYEISVNSWKKVSSATATTATDTTASATTASASTASASTASATTNSATNVETTSTALTVSSVCTKSKLEIGLAIRETPGSDKEPEESQDNLHVDVNSSGDAISSWEHKARGLYF